MALPPLAKKVLNVKSATALGVSSPEALLPIMFELAVASLCYLILLLKKTTRHNFTISITYSSFKLLGLSSLLVTNFSPIGLVRIPFVVGLIVNEVVLLIASIRNRIQFQSITIKSMYTKRLLALRTAGELLTVAAYTIISVGTQFFRCPCPLKLVVVGQELTSSRECDWSKTAKFVAHVVSPQLRGLALAIGVTVGAVSVSGWKFMLMGFHSDLTKLERDSLNDTLKDMPWKKAVRAAYSYLTLLAIGLFAIAFFVPGLANCSNHVETIGGVHRVRYTLGAVSAAYLNSLLAISQMFVADIHVRLAAIKEVEGFEEHEHEADGDEGIPGDERRSITYAKRVESAMVHRTTKRPLA